MCGTGVRAISFSMCILCMACQWVACENRPGEGGVVRDPRAAWRVHGMRRGVCTGRGVIVVYFRRFPLAPPHAPGLFFPSLSLLLRSPISFYHFPRRKRAEGGGGGVRGMFPSTLPHLPHREPRTERPRGVVFVFTLPLNGRHGTRGSSPASSDRPWPAAAS